MLLYVTLVSLKRATYSKKKKGEGDEFASEQRARRWKERDSEDKRTAVHRKTYIH